MAFDRKQYKKEWDKKRQGWHTKLVQRYKLRKGCQLCGYKKHFAALCLDHIDPETKDRSKRGSYRAINPKWKKDRIKQEIAKCQVLCANCHQERTYGEKHYEFVQSTKKNGPELGSTGRQ